MQTMPDSEKLVGRYDGLIVNILNRIYSLPWLSGKSFFFIVIILNPEQHSHDSFISVFQIRFDQGSVP